MDVLLKMKLVMKINRLVSSLFSLSLTLLHTHTLFLSLTHTLSHSRSSFATASVFFLLLFQRETLHSGKQPVDLNQKGEAEGGGRGNWKFEWQWLRDRNWGFSDSHFHSLPPTHLCLPSLQHERGILHSHSLIKSKSRIPTNTPLLLLLPHIDFSWKNLARRILAKATLGRTPNLKANSNYFSNFNFNSFNRAFKWKHTAKYFFIVLCQHLSNWKQFVPID